MGWVILGIIFFLLMLLFWHYFQYQIKDFIRWIRVGEMWLVSLFVDEANYNVPWRGGALNFQLWQDATPSIPPKELSTTVMSQISTVTMYPLRYVFSAILIIMGFWALFYGPRTHYRRKLNLAALIERQAAQFPSIAPFIDFNPAEMAPRPPGSPVPAELPVFAEALGPEEWLAYNEIALPDGRVDFDSAYRGFAKQLGKPWRGPLHLSPDRQVLMAAFCLKVARKRADADEILGELARSWSHKNGLKLSWKLVARARKILKDRDMTAKVMAKCNQHAYENTAMLRALLTAREEGGVMAPAQFVWLRAHDRTLWYVLNNLGRQAFHIEGLGAMAHYKAEKMTQRPIPRPKVDACVESIQDYLNSPKVRPIPALDYSKSKKRGIKKLKGSA